MTDPPVVASYDAATSVLGKNLQSLRSMLSNVAAVQDLFGAANATDAAKRIYIGCLPDPASKVNFTAAELTGYRPYAIVATTERPAIQSELQSVGGTWTHGRRGVFDILLERSHPSVIRADEAELQWIDLVDSVRQSNDTDNPGLIELNDNGQGFITLRTVEVLEIWRSDPLEKQSAGDYQAAILRVHWGR